MPQTTLRNSSDDSTSRNYQLYEMVTVGQVPVSVAGMKSYLGLSSSKTNFDDVLLGLLRSCTSWGQNYTSKEFTNNEYELLIDEFEDRISVRRHPIDTIDDVEYLVSGSLVTVDASIFYLKKGRYLSEILLFSDKSWPTDGDDREQGIKISFTTKAISDDQMEMVKNAIKRHVAYMFENRGDCGDCGECGDIAGATPLYNMIRSVRV